jgi:hypothetical protein
MTSLQRTLDAQHISKAFIYAIVPGNDVILNELDLSYITQSSRPARAAFIEVYSGEYRLVKVGTRYRLEDMAG